MERIATGAEEPSGASQESLTAITQILKGAEVSAKNAELAVGKGWLLQQLVEEVTGDIERMIKGINVLKAAIEAARAGEHGKGFAVVARRGAHDR